jgi:purine-cytosine permease-like protein
MKNKLAVILGMAFAIGVAVWAAPQSSEQTSIVKVKDRMGNVVAILTLVQGSKMATLGPAMADQTNTRFQTHANPGSGIRVVSVNGSELFVINTGTNSFVEYEATATKQAQ